MMSINAATRKVLVAGLLLVCAAGTFYLGAYYERQSQAATSEDSGARSFSTIQSTAGMEASDGAGGTEAEPVADRDLVTAPAPLTKRQIEDLAYEAFKEPNQLKRSLAFAKLLESLTPENALEIREKMGEFNANRDEWELFTYAWGSVDGEGAIAHAETLEGRQRTSAMQQSLTGWASASPASAISWLEGQGEVEDLQRLRSSLIGGLADYDIGTATDQAYKFAAQGDKRAAGYLENIAEEKLRSGNHLEAASWAGALRDGPLKGAALDRVAGRYVDQDPAAAAKWAGQFASEDYGVRVIEEVSDEWAERDPQAAVAWLETIPQGTPQSEGMESAFEEWVERDPRAASEYLAKMPASDSRDAAVNGFAEELSGNDPLSAVVWAETIGQEDLRIRTLTRVARNWYRRDSTTALEWIESANLPPKAVEEILVRDRRGRRGG